MRLRALMSFGVHPCKAARALSTPPLCFLRAHSVSPSVSSWLQGIEQQQHSHQGQDACSGILQQAEFLEQRVSRQLPIEGVQFAAVGRGVSSMARPNNALVLGSNLVVQQCIEMPSDYSVPDQTTIPAYQLVGIFRAILGYPTLPRHARSSSLEAKWGLLSLLLLHAAGQQQEHQLKQQQLLDQVVLQHAADKVAQVLVNPHVPLLNKQAAEQRYQQLYSSCNSIVTAWVTATCATHKFQLLKPAMQGIEVAMESSVAVGSQQTVSDTSNSGKLMEETALQVLQASLPPGWSLVPSLHLLGADGETFEVEQGCKYEVDMLVLDEQGVATAVVEVKLAAANPLMSLFNDVNALLNLVDRIAGKTVSGITRSTVSDTAAASTAAVAAAAAAQGGSAPGSVLAKVKAAALPAPFGEQVWQQVHVKVHEDVTPMYIIGRHIGEEDVVKGLASLVDSSALKLLARSPATTAAALRQAERRHQQDQSLDQVHSSHTGLSGGQSQHVEQDDALDEVPLLAVEAESGTQQQDEGKSIHIGQLTSQLQHAEQADALAEQLILSAAIGLGPQQKGQLQSHSGALEHSPQHVAEADASAERPVLAAIPETSTEQQEQGQISHIEQCHSQQQGDIGADALAGSPPCVHEAEAGTQQQPRRTSSSSTGSSSSNGRSASYRVNNRVQVNLSKDMQDGIALQIYKRFEVLHRCKVYSLCGAAQDT